jgi:hypothetical protein
MHDTLRMLFVELMTGAALLDVISTSEISTVASESHTADGIKDRKLVLVAKNQAGRSGTVRSGSTSYDSSFNVTFLAGVFLSKQSGSLFYWVSRSYRKDANTTHLVLV